MKRLVSYWYSKHPCLTLLLPFSYLYLLGLNLHKALYVLGIKKKFKSPRPVIVVGNLTVGGTGKTPLTIALAQLLLEQGLKPGIISRGYKGKAKAYPLWVTADSDPKQVGDEPLLLIKKTGCPVVVAPKRSEAIKMLLEKGCCDIIISDDGLQHHAIKKDVEIIVVDAKRKFGNGWCLPAGPLREPLKKLSRVSFIVYNQMQQAHAYSMSFNVGDIYNLVDPDLKRSPHFFKNTRIHAVAAIGHPERFFDTLRELGMLVETHTYPDHHHYSLADFSWCKENDIIIMTEKDAVKCQKIPLNNCWVLPIFPILSDDLKTNFLSTLNKLLSTRSE